jgi:drug/metabolite transporter, DME family
MVMAAASLWGTLGLFGKALLPTGVTPVELASVRSAVGFTSLAVWLVIVRRSIGIRWRDLPFFAVYGALSVALFQYVYFAAIERTAISIAAALLYTAPAFVVVLARIFLAEALTATRLVALGMVLGGVLLVTGAVQTVTAGAAPIPLAAAGFGLASGLTYGLYTLFGKTALRRALGIERWARWLRRRRVERRLGPARG